MHPQHARQRVLVFNLLGREALCRVEHAFGSSFYLCGTVGLLDSGFRHEPIIDNPKNSDADQWDHFAENAQLKNIADIQHTQEENGSC